MATIATSTKETKYYDYDLTVSNYQSSHPSSQNQRFRSIILLKFHLHKAIRIDKIYDLFDPQDINLIESNDERYTAEYNVCVCTRLLLYINTPKPENLI